MVDDHRLAQLLTWAEQSFFVQCGKLLHSSGTAGYIVGGYIRDILLGIPCVDIDIMIEENIDRFIPFVEEEFPVFFPMLRVVKVQRHPKYLTAKIYFSDEIVPGVSVLDFSQARREAYPIPGDSPVVEGSSIEEDSRRRDFSVNALLLELGVSGYRVIDLVGGVEDLRSRSLRILHDRSFMDDPARLLRGVRLETRLGFEFESATFERLHEAVQGEYLHTLPRYRLYDELLKACGEDHYVKVIQRCCQLGFAGQLFPGLEESCVFDRVSALAMNNLTGNNLTGQMGGLISPVERFVALYVGSEERLLSDFLSQARLASSKRKKMVELFHQLSKGFVSKVASNGTVTE